MDKNRIERYLAQISEEAADLVEVLKQPDEEVLASPRLIKSCKYSLIVISEAMADTLQHILANRLQPFIRFRNMLVHQYWRIDERKFLENLRSGMADFKSFIREVKKITDEVPETSNGDEAET